MAIKKILVPYNFTRFESKSLDFVISTYASQQDFKVTLFNVYTPLPEIDTGANPELSKMRGAMASLSDELRQKEEGLKSAKQHLLENGFSEDRVDYIFQEKKTSVAEEIIETLSKGLFKVLVLSHHPTKVSRLFGRSVHSKILSTLKDVTVCIAA